MHPHGPQVADCHSRPFLEKPTANVMGCVSTKKRKLCRCENMQIEDTLFKSLSSSEWLSKGVLNKITCPANY
jgi:hypothetical protein